MNLITRQALYDLVWSKPTRLIALDLGISDVWIAKLCRRFDIPKPPPGYWRKLETGRRVPPIPLPPLLPFESEYTIRLSERHQSPPYTLDDVQNEFEWIAPEKMTDPLPKLPERPSLSEETLNEIRLWGLKLTEKFRFRYSYTTRMHPAIKGALENDRLRKKSIDDNGRKIKVLGAVYRSPEGASLLKALHYIFWGIRDLGGNVHACDHEHPYWFAINALSFNIGLVIVDYKAQGLKPPTIGGQPITYGYKWFLGRIHWHRGAITGEITPIPGFLDIAFYRQMISELAIQLKLSEHNKSLESYQKAQDKRSATIESRKRFLDNLENDRRQLTESALNRISEADRLRSLMTVLEGSRLFDQNKESYENWKEWAEQYLKVIDPREMDAHQIGKWLEAYQFDLRIPID